MPKVPNNRFDAIQGYSKTVLLDTHEKRMGVKQDSRWWSYLREKPF